MKPTRFPLFAPSRLSCCMLLAIAGFSTAPASAALDSTAGEASINTYNGSTAANGLTTTGNWDKGTPFLSGGAGIGGHLLFTGTSGTTFRGTGGSNSMNGASYNVTNGSSYTLQVNTSNTHDYRVGFTTNGSTNTESVAAFTNPVSSIAQDLIHLSNGSNLTFNATNDGNLVSGNLVVGAPATMNLRQTGNFNIGAGSVLTINTAVNQRTSGIDLNITGGGTTIMNGANNYSGATIISGGTLEITGSNAATNYTLQRGTDMATPVLKLSNQNALPASATLTGASSSATTGNVDLAVAGVHTLGVYNGNNLAFTASNGQATTLHFTGASRITSGGATSRTLTTTGANLHVVFDSTLDIGGSVNGGPIITGSGNTTVHGELLSTGDGIRSLTKNGGGTLTLNSAGEYTGGTTVNDGTLLVNNTTGSATGSGDLNVNAAATLGGSGIIAGATTTLAGTLAPGTSPGALTIAGGTLALVAGSDYEFQVHDASAAAGIGHDTVNLTSGAVLDLSALTSGSFTIHLLSLAGISPDAGGNAINFDPSQNHSWTLFSTGSAITSFESGDFILNDSGFSNSLSGGAFSVGLADGNTDLVVNFTAVPEPHTILLGGIGLLGLLRRQRVC